MEKPIKKQKTVRNQLWNRRNPPETPGGALVFYVTLS